MSTVRTYIYNAEAKEVVTETVVNHGVTIDEALEVAGAERYRGSNIDDPDYIMPDGREVWVEEIEVVSLRAGETYEDPDGEWEITAINDDTVDVRNIQEGNSNYGKEFTVPLAEAIYYTNQF